MNSNHIEVSIILKNKNNILELIKCLIIFVLKNIQSEISNIN